MKKAFIVAVAIHLIAGCKKNDTDSPLIPALPSTPPAASYSSMKDFHDRNIVKSEFFSFKASSGGVFKTTKGTTIRVKPDAFLDFTGNTYAGHAELEFKDIYSKSDMLLSDMCTQDKDNKPLKSAGEFFIRVKGGSQFLDLNPDKPVVVEQPLFNQPPDENMVPFVQNPFDSSGSNPNGWFRSPEDSLRSTFAGYVYTLRRFTSAQGGTWLNTDNPTFFDAYPQTVLTLVPSDNMDKYGTELYLAFKGVNTMIHLYPYQSVYTYQYAPVGLSCTLVAIGCKDGKMYYAMTDLSIKDKLSVPFSLVEIKAEDLKKKLNTLND